MNEYRRYSEWKGWGAEFAVRDHIMERYYQAELSLAGHCSVSDLRILELGFGAGGFAAWSLAGGARYVGTEAIPLLVEQALKHGVSAMDHTADLVNELGKCSQDLVVAFDVLEHLDREAIEQMLSQLWVILSPGGKLLARVPSGDSPFSGAIQNGDLTHRSSLGSSAVTQLAQRAGFEVLQVRAPAYPLRGKGILSTVRRALVVGMRKVCHRVIALAMMENGSAVLTPNMVFLLRKPFELGPSAGLTANLMVGKVCAD